MRLLALVLAMAIAAPASAQDTAEPPAGTTPEGAGAGTSAQDRGGAAASEGAGAIAPDDAGAIDAEGDAAVVGEAEADAPDGDVTAADDEADADESDADESDADESDVEAPAPPHWTDERAGAWAGFGASFGVALLGGILLAVGIDDVNTIENAPGGTVWVDVADARDRAPILTGLGGVTLGLGVAGMAVSAALLAYFGQGGTWLEVSVLPAGVGVRGRF